MKLNLICVNEFTEVNSTQKRATIERCPHCSASHVGVTLLLRKSIWASRTVTTACRV